MRAAIYTRISKDDDGDRLGVQRQEQDLRQEGARRGAEVVTVYEDNDLSGSGLAIRPAFENLITAIEAGQVDLVLVYDMDRLFRGLKPFVRFYEAAERARIMVAWIGGEANFATGTGLFELELRATFAREELRKIKQRTRRKHLELAEKGLDAGGGRPFGYEADRHSVVEAEAELIREAARRVLDGEPLRSIATDWNGRGIAAVRSGRWSARVIKRILASGRISGRREYYVGTDGKRRTMGGAITAEADWPAIIDVDMSDRLRAVLLAPERTKEARPRKYLLSGGLACCGRCGKPLHTSTERGGRHRSYDCISGPGFSGGCGRLRIHAEPLEEYVVGQVLAAVDEGAIARALAARQEDGSARDELLAVEARLAELATGWATQAITTVEWQAARAALAARQETLQRQVQAQQRRLALDGLETAPLRSEWPVMPLHRQRAVLRLLLDYVEVRPASRRGPVFDTHRIVLHWT